MSNSKVTDFAKNIISDALNNLGSFSGDFDELRESAQELVWENEVIYYSEGLEVIGELESKFGDCVEDYGVEYKAEDWQKAMMAYANQLFQASLMEEVGTAFDEL